MLLSKETYNLRKHSSFRTVSEPERVLSAKSLNRESCNNKQTCPDRRADVRQRGIPLWFVPPVRSHEVQTVFALCVGVAGSADVPWRRTSRKIRLNDS